MIAERGQLPPGQLAFLFGDREPTTILRLLKEVGDNCTRLLDERMRGLSCREIAADEVCAGRYSPPKVRGVEIIEIAGRPERSRVCTCYVERNNLTIRMRLRRFTRLTNGFSKELANLKAVLALHFAWYDFCRIHGSLRVMPAMAAGITDQVWDLREPL